MCCTIGLSRLNPNKTDGPHLHGGRVGVPSNLDGQGKLCGEDWQRAQLAREHKVKQRPQLGEPILDRGAAHDDSVHCLKLLGCQCDFCIWVAHLMALV